MLPLHLRLRNFMSYGLEGGDLDLRAIHLACLSGANGHGKSALIDAMTWALWGRSRASREDDLLRQGTTEMEVELEFFSGGAVYRVIRKRTLRKSGAVAVLELAVRDGQGYRAITGNTVRETEEAIARLLRLSYETFINSSLLLQGKADSFTIKRPAERKEVLAEILGLQRYEELAEGARQQERDYRQRAEHLEERIKELDHFVALLPTLAERLQQAEAGLVAKEAEHATAEHELTQAEARLKSLETLRDTLEQSRSRLAAIKAEEGRLRVAQQDAARRRADAERLLCAEQGIRERLLQLQRARTENDLLNARLRAYSELYQRTTVLAHRIGDLEQTVRRDQRSVAESLAAAQAAAQGLEPARVALAALLKERSTLPAAERDVEDLRHRDRSLAEDIAALQATNGTRDARMKELREKIKALRASGARCPVCDSELSEEHRRKVLDDYLQEGSACKEEVEANKQRAVQLQQQQEAVRRELAAQEAWVKHLQRQGPQEGNLRARVQELEQKAEPLAHLQAEEARLRLLLEREDFAHEERRALREVQEQLRVLDYDAVAHQALQERIAALAPAEQELQQLEGARLQQQQAMLDLATAQARLQGAIEEAQRLERDQEPLQELLRGLPAMQQECEQRRCALAEVRRAEGALREELGTLRGSIELGRQYEKERVATIEALDLAHRQEWAHHELAIIFGKRGLQAMLIENALPELEQEANELLARMTDNSTQVQFITQRQARTGSAIETLDIKIADNLGTRSYEMFSGGEAFRISFAIRLALSRLLARRAGAELSFLLIDEGFGSQDSQGRDRLVEAITAIADDFQRILVVTHIDELKDLFDTHIEVTKGPGGSQIAISAA